MTQISPDTGFELIRRLVDAADRREADLMVTVCPMCQMNIDAYQGEMNRHFHTSYHMPILFFTQLIGLAFGVEPKALGIGSEIVSAEPRLAPHRDRGAAAGGGGRRRPGTPRASAAGRKRPAGPADAARRRGRPMSTDQPIPAAAEPSQPVRCDPAVDGTGETPRIGVYVCHCGTNIAGMVDVAAVRDWAAERLGPHGVVVARDYPFMCSSLGQELIEQDIHELGLDRVVVAACSPHMHEKTFRGACERAGLNPYLCELVSIREQVSWVHTDKDAATAKAKAIVAGGVLRVREQVPLEPLRVPINTATLVVGGGIAGISAALEIADAGFPVHLVERQPSIGGHMAQFDKTFPTLDCAACILTPKMVTAGTHPNITLHTWSEVTDVSGYVGNFTVKVLHRPRYVDTDLCTGCGICEEKCPAKVVDEAFEAGIGYRKAIYRPFPQAVPKFPVLDPDNCIYFEKGTCKACEKLCPPGAIRPRPAARGGHARGRQHRAGHRLRAVRRAAGRAVRLRPAGQRLHQPRVRADEQRQRADRRADRAARRRDRAAERGDRPLRRQPRPQLQRLLLGDLLHAEHEVRPPRPRAHGRDGLRVLHRHPGAGQGVRRVLPARPGRGHDLHPRPRGRGHRRPPPARGGRRGRPADRPGRGHARRPAAPDPGRHGRPLGRPRAAAGRARGRPAVRHHLQLARAGSSSATPSSTRSRR